MICFHETEMKRRKEGGYKLISIRYNERYIRVRENITHSGPRKILKIHAAAASAKTQRVPLNHEYFP